MARLSTSEKANIRKYLGLAVGCLGKFVAGSLFTFNVYQDEIKTTFNYTQQIVELHSSLINIGLGVGFVPGILYDRFGPTWTSFAGLVLSVSSFLLLWNAPSHQLFYNRNSWLVALYFFMTGFGSIFTYMAALNTNVINFRSKHRGVVVGLMNAFFSGSPVVFSIVYYRILTGSKKFSEFMLIFAICFTVVDILCILCLRLVQVEEQEINLKSSKECSKEEEENDKTEGLDDDNCKTESADFSFHSQDASKTKSCENNENTDELTARQNNQCLSLKQLCFSTDFHLFLWMFVFATSVGLTIVNNLTVISQSLELSEYNATLVLVIPISASVLSIIIGLMSDILKTKVERMTLLVCACVCQIVCLTIILVFGNVFVLLLLGTLLCGVGVASLWSLSPAMVSEKFGMNDIGRNWGIVILLASVIGLLTQEIFGLAYDAYVPAGQIYCVGMKCISGGLGLLLAASIISVVFGAAYIIASKRRRQYEHLN